MTKRRLSTGLLIPLLICCPMLAQPASAGENGREGPGDVRGLGADLGTAWFDAIYELVRDTPDYNPTVASRTYAYCGLTFYEALVHGIPRGKSLAGQLNGLDSLPEPGPERYLWSVVANAAMQRVATHFFPGSAGRIDGLANELFAKRGPIDRLAFRRSVDYGVILAEAIIDWANADGYLELAARNAAYVAPVMPGGWVGTGSGVNPAWGQQRPFVLESATSCPAVGHPPFSEEPSSAFHAHAQIVYATTGDAGAALTDEQKDIAFFWSDGPGATGTPPGHWIHTVGIVARQQGLDLAEVAEAYARVGLAVGDAFIACWQAKFTTYLLRPVTYIQSHIDPDWTPLIATPNFPTYTSGHSTQSGAATFVLTHQLGAIPYVDTIHVDRGNTVVLDELAVDTRRFDSFLDAGAEAAVSRLYGGIHYLFDNFEGLQQGQCIGARHVEALEFDRQPSHR